MYKIIAVFFLVVLNILNCSEVNASNVSCDQSKQAMVLGVSRYSQGPESYPSVPAIRHSTEKVIGALKRQRFCVMNFSQPVVNNSDYISIIRQFKEQVSAYEQPPSKIVIYIAGYVEFLDGDVRFLSYDYNANAKNRLIEIQKQVSLKKDILEFVDRAKDFGIVFLDIATKRDSIKPQDKQNWSKIASRDLLKNKSRVIVSLPSYNQLANGYYFCDQQNKKAADENICSNLPFASEYGAGLLHLLNKKNQLFNELGLHVARVNYFTELSHSLSIGQGGAPKIVSTEDFDSQDISLHDDELEQIETDIIDLVSPVGLMLEGNDVNYADRIWAAIMDRVNPSVKGGEESHRTQDYYQIDNWKEGDDITARFIGAVNRIGKGRYELPGRSHRDFCKPYFESGQFDFFMTVGRVPVAAKERFSKTLDTDTISSTDIIYKIALEEFISNHNVVTGKGLELAFKPIRYFLKMSLYEVEDSNKYFGDGYANHYSVTPCDLFVDDNNEYFISTFAVRTRPKLQQSGSLTSLLDGNYNEEQSTEELLNILGEDFKLLLLEIAEASPQCRDVNQANSYELLNSSASFVCAREFIKSIKFEKPRNDNDTYVWFQQLMASKTVVFPSGRWGLTGLHQKKLQEKVVRYVENLLMNDSSLTLTIQVIGSSSSSPHKGGPSLKTPLVLPSGIHLENEETCSSKKDVSLSNLPNTSGYQQVNIVSSNCVLSWARARAGAQYLVDELARFGARVDIRYMGDGEAGSYEQAQSIRVLRVKQ